MTRSELGEYVRSLGFSNLGIWRVGTPLHHEFYEDWLARGFHGEMNYLAEHAAIKRNVRSLLPDCESVIAVTLDYNQENPPRPGYPRIARYALGRDYHNVIRGKLKRLQKELSQSNPGASFRICVDSAPLLEREIGHGAGLGWFGKNTLLIDSRRGSYFLLGFLLTSIAWEPDKPSLGGCGSCRKCIDACPTGAIVFEDGRWQVDSRSCISYLTIEKKSDTEDGLKLAGWTFGCDVCQEVCPFNQPRTTQPLRGAFATEPDLLNRREWPDLEHLRQIGFEEWDRLTRGSPVRRTGWVPLKMHAARNIEECQN